MSASPQSPPAPAPPARAAPDKRNQGPSLRAKLLLAAAFVLLPTILLTIVGDALVLQERRAEVPQADLALARTVADVVDVSLDEAISVGWAIADAPTTRGLNPADLDPMLQAMKPLYPQFGNVVVFDAQGRDVGDMLPYPAGAPRANGSDRADFRQAMQTNAPSVTGLEPDARLSQPVVHVAVPIRGASGRPIGVVAIAFNFDGLQSRLGVVPLADQRVVVITDPTGRLAFTNASTTAGSASINLADAPLIRRAMAGQPAVEGSTQLPILDGSWLGGAVASPRYHWIAAVLQPTSVATAAILPVVLLDLAGLLLALILSAIVGIYVTGRILVPIRSLAHAARSWTRGDLDERVEIHSHDELEALGDTFDAMASSLSHTLDRLTETDRRLVEESNRLRAIVNTSPVGIIVLSPAERIVLANPAAEALLGERLHPSVPASEYLIIPHLYHPDGRPFAYDDLPVVRSLRDGATVVGSEVIVRRPNGWELHLLVNAAPIRESDGRIVGSVAVFFDVTPIAEEERLRTEFVVSAAHEFRNPLTVIKGYAEMAMRSAQVKGTPVFHELERIVDAANRLSHLSDDLLRSAQLHLPPLVLRHDRIDLAQLVGRVVHDFTSAPAGHNYPVALDARPVEVDGDPKLLGEAIDNLLRQAEAAMPGGGPIGVKVSSWDGIATVAVTDHGPVVPPDRIPSLFRPFSLPGHEPSDGVAARQSLLLYLAKRIVEESGGWVRAESTPAGTTISVTLPRHAPGLTEALPPAEAPANGTTQGALAPPETTFPGGRK